MNTQKDLNILHDILDLILELSPHLAEELEDDVRALINDVSAFEVGDDE